MSELWVSILLVAAVSVGIKAAGPALLGDRELPPWASAVIAALAPALLAGLVVTDVTGQGWSALDWRLCAGLGVAGGAYLLKLPALPSITLAVVVTAGLRWVV
ncbi:AzlD domain-containing protein [Amycolatopsis magusensis]|uniref:Branched-subunit amino acid transport protein n=1 Tax=Amycolatopsis magusensis TaxID=882444 RepID=A0ABS4Q387_9PSEU|nr:AzlD domain-containing protein [Amycolatopsis magusensis]MBP2186147.1 branched-subunit amino acid transport protein [Amycolatopsis magusensis]